MKKIMAIGLFSILSTPAVADIDPWVVISDIPGLVSDLWPSGDRGSKGKSFDGAPNDYATSGEFNVTTYNVDGFPHSIGGNTNNEFKQIMYKLNDAPLDMVLLQEVFIEDKHDKIRDKLSENTYPYRSKHFRGGVSSFGDGLIRLSRFPFDKSDGFKRKEWPECGGVDCYTEKGFSFQRHYITAEFVLDVYNLHVDAGGQEEDIKAKRKSMEYLAEYIKQHSGDNAIIIAGDYNLGWHDPDNRDKADDFRAIVDGFLTQTQTQFVCELTTGNLDICGEVFNKPDHIAFKSGKYFELIPTSLEYLRYFVDDKGKDLSDHLPLKANFSWYKK